MKLYLLSDNTVVQKHLSEAFDAYTHHSIDDTIPFDLEKDSVVFVHDTLLEGMSEVGLKSLFSLHVMVLSTLPTFERSSYFLSLGARGYGNTMMHASHLHSAYETIVEGNIWLIPEYITQLIQGLPKKEVAKKDHLAYLSHREKEVALFLAEGHSHKEIAKHLDITIRTVKAHATAIYHKLEIKDRLCLALLLRS